MRWISVTVVACLTVTACAGSDSASEEAPVVERPAPVSTVARPSSAPPDTDAATTTSTEEPAAADAEEGVEADTTTSTSTTTTTTTIPPDPPPPNDQFVGLTLGVDPVADIRYPTALAWRGEEPGMYVSTQDGQVWRVDGDDAEPVLVADIGAETVEFAPGSERGLLGLAFDPRDGRMFLNYTDLAHDSHVISFQLLDGVADSATRRQVLFFEQPGLGHNGGRLVFDADGHLFIGSGDGGGSNGRDAQDTTKILGALLRITPKLDGEGYDIPADNPFADGVADRPEVFARGFRNPWTFSLDDDTGDIWIGDVGNDAREEIDLIPGGTSGQNFGWYWFEGTNQRRSDFPEGLVPPVFDYPRSDGVAVMGGHVYRGDAIPALRGVYLFGDLTGPIWGIGADGASRLEVERVRTLVGWGEDPSGELYLLALDDGVFRLVPR